MSSIHFGTFDAERYWRPSGLAQLPAVRTGGGTAVATMDEVLAAGCAPGDLLITRRALPPAVRQSLGEAGIVFDHLAAESVPSPLPRALNERGVERLMIDNLALSESAARYNDVQPYAVLPDTVSLLTQWGRASDVPSVDVVARVNSKTWSNTLARTLGLPGCASVVRSVSELCSAAQEFGPSVVVKDPYGVSGRGALRVNSPGVLRAVQRVLSRQEGEGRTVELLVQPEFPKKCDFSGHLQVNRDGMSRFLGVQVMVNDGFRHLGSGPAGAELTDLLDRHGYRHVLADVGAALADEGYHGPIGVDSMVLEDNSLVPVLEINARRSLGLLALLAGHRVAQTGLACHLWQLELTLGADQSVDDVLAALRKARLLYAGGARPGVLVLGGGSLSEPDGRLYGLSYCATDDAPLWQHRVTDAVKGAGMKPRGAGDDA
ncbi:hypothetical protein CIW47_10810 [Mycolicibacterium sp. P1-5]|nr:hypothetical protein CIW47_10810 [Mycolicibacterium sp. P1-5]